MCVGQKDCQLSIEFETFLLQTFCIFIGIFLLLLLLPQWFFGFARFAFHLISFFVLFVPFSYYYDYFLFAFTMFGFLLVFSAVVSVNFAFTFYVSFGNFCCFFVGILF